MPDRNGDGAAVRIPPPMVYLGLVIAGVVLNAFVWPLALDLGLALRAGATVVLGLAGAALLVTAFGLFSRTGQDPKPWESTPEIITSGIYGYTRNPMYVGMGLLQAALGVGLANLWIVVLVPAVLSIVYLTAIRHEEAYLESKFGQSYTDYKASVRRWL